MNDDFGCVCADCGTVTIFERRASYTRHCAKCGRALASSRRREVREVPGSSMARSYTSPEFEDELRPVGVRDARNASTSSEHDR